MAKLLFVLLIAGVAGFVYVRFVRPLLRLDRAVDELEQQMADLPPEALLPPPPAPVLAEREGLSPEVFAEVDAALAALALPAISLSAAPEHPVAAGGTRLGGPAWLAEGEDWPQGKDGRPLEFLAQADFGALPPLADFPEAGLLQFFVGRDDLYGSDFDNPLAGNILLRWYPEPLTGGRLAPPPPLARPGSAKGGWEDVSPFWDNAEAMRSNGTPMIGQRIDMRPLGMDSRAHPVVEALVETPYLKLSDADWERLFPYAPNHHVGGHPAFVQNDFRARGEMPPYDGSPSPFSEYDRVLLRLTSKDGLMWGDAGEANFFIRHADLIARDFSRVVWWWDCS